MAGGVVPNAPTLSSTDRWGQRSLPIMAALALVAIAACAHGQETNSLGMKMVPVPGTKILMATTEVTVDQYRAAGLGYQAPKFAQSGNHPAVNVSWNDAKKYCAWLSKKEGKKYRLPTDHEWSCAVGIGHLEDPRASPASKGQKRGVPRFPWGVGLPKGKVGNYMGQEWRGNETTARQYFSGAKGVSLIPGYDDGVLFTAPVGSYAPNNLGICDLGGNVEEWCLDKPGRLSAGEFYSGDMNSGVIRGGSWTGSYGFQSRSDSRRGIFEDSGKNDYTGFRVVCESR